MISMEPQLYARNESATDYVDSEFVAIKIIICDYGAPARHDADEREASQVDGNRRESQWAQSLKLHLPPCYQSCIRRTYQVNHGSDSRGARFKFGNRPTLCCQFHRGKHGSSLGKGS
jgi:hypothetical protein